MIEDFGTLPDGSTVQRVTIRGGGLTAQVIGWGAVLQSLRLEGHAPSLVLGLNSLDDYLAHSRYFGATAGRCANRIRDGALHLGGRDWQLDRNFLGRHHLHGGSAGIGKRAWRIDAHGDDSVTLGITLADGEMGYPGAMQISYRLTLTEAGALDLLYTAEAQAETLCNLAHHSYWNLDGAAAVLDHRLDIAADHVLPVDDDLIPTGAVAPVAGSAFDLRQPRRLGEVVADQALDHNFCLAPARRDLAPAARLTSPAAGLSLLVETTEPGLQVYDGAKLDVPVAGLDGRRYGPHAGVAIEPQVWPDANHHPDFPQAILRPGETYRQHSRFTVQRLPA